MGPQEGDIGWQIPSFRTPQKRGLCKRAERKHGVHCHCFPGRAHSARLPVDTGENMEAVLTLQMTGSYLFACLLQSEGGPQLDLSEQVPATEENIMGLRNTDQQQQQNLQQQKLS